MLHYVIAYKVSNALSIKDKERFYVGTLIPDLSSHEDGSYSKAHFLSKNSEVVEKRFDWYLFEEQYRDKLLEDSLYLGYLCHLISDEVWFKKITDRYVRIYPKKDRITYIKKGYEDFRKLNTLLIEKYDLQNPNLSMLEIELEEVKVNLLGQLLEDFEKDFVVNGRFEKDDLLIYPYDAIMEFLDESIEICIKEIQNLMNQYILYHGSAIKDLKEIKANAYSHKCDNSSV